MRNRIVLVLTVVPLALASLAEAQSTPPPPGFYKHEAAPVAQTQPGFASPTDLRIGFNDKQELVFLWVNPQRSANLQGAAIGQQITGLDGQSTAGMTLAQVRQLLAGQGEIGIHWRGAEGIAVVDRSRIDLIQPNTGEPNAPTLTISVHRTIPTATTPAEVFDLNSEYSGFLPGDLRVAAYLEWPDNAPAVRTTRKLTFAWLDPDGAPYATDHDTVESDIGGHGETVTSHANGKMIPPGVYTLRVTDAATGKLLASATFNVEPMAPTGNDELRRSHYLAGIGSLLAALANQLSGGNAAAQKPAAAPSPAPVQPPAPTNPDAKPAAPAPVFTQPAEPLPAPTQPTAQPAAPTAAPASPAAAPGTGKANGDDALWHLLHPLAGQKAAGAPPAAAAATSTPKPPAVVAAQCPVYLQCLAVSPDGNLVAVGGLDKQVRVWDLGTGAVKYVKPVHAYGQVSAVAFSPNGATLAVGTDDGITLLHAATGDPIPVPQQAGTDLLDFAGDGVHALAWSPDGSLLAAAVSDRIYVCDVLHTRIVWWAQLDHDAPCVAVRPGASPVAAVSGKQIRFFDLATGRKVEPGGGWDKLTSVGYIGYTPDGKNAFVQSDESGLFDADTATRVWAGGSADYATISDTGKTAAFYAGSTIVVQNLRTGAGTASIPFSDVLEALALTPDGSRLLAVSGKTLHVWDIQQFPYKAPAPAGDDGGFFFPF